MTSKSEFHELKNENILSVIFRILNNQMPVERARTFSGLRISTVEHPGSDDGAWDLKLKIPTFSLQKTVSFFRSERFVSSIANHPVYWPAATRLGRTLCIVPVSGAVWCGDVAAACQPAGT